ncbi:ABC transporter ATP-binding protein [Formosa sp. A9]|uniref:ABC transporter ATP-binding protein n=1 Tax=Formosa sp. A9 TaxID=3442641 RepID=UPI003EBF2A17
MLQVENIAFSYNNTPILKHLSFTAKPGEHLSIIGESGSGKSTLLKLIYGTYDLHEGTIRWKNQSILGPKFNLVIGYDFMKYVAQEFDLMPFISVEENIGKFLSNFFPEDKKKRTLELIKLVELEDFAKVKVKYLSGGQKQRVALARAIARQPEIILLDEPFSHIDNFQKQSLRRNLFEYLKTHNITCIVATHDREDVLPFADQILVLHDGNIVASGAPQTLYANPEQPLIASFFGEFNIINQDIVYAHQLKIVTSSSIKAVVQKSYFKGHIWLIAAKFNEETIYFEHLKPLPENDIIFLDILKN